MSTGKSSKKKTLRGKLTLLVLLPIVVMALILTVYMVFSSYNDTIGYISDEAMSLSYAYSSHVENMLNSIEKQFDVITMNPDLVDHNLSLDERKATLAECADASTFNDYSIAYSDGLTYNSTDISQREYFIEAMNNKSAYFSTPIVRMIDNSLTIIAAKHFIAPNGEECLVYGGIDTDFYSNMIKDVKFGEGAISFILDKHGFVIGSNTDQLPLLTDLSDVNNVDKNMLGPARLAAWMRTYNSGTRLCRINGVDYYAGYTPINGEEGWTIAVMTPFSPLIINIIKECATILIMSIILVALAIIVSSFSIKKISKRVVKISERLSTFSQGDITSPAPICDSGDEIEQMTNSLSGMISSLSSYIGDIHDVLTGISRGDLTVATSVVYKGEFESIKDSLDTIIDSIHNVMKDVGVSAGQVKNGATQLADGSSQLSQNAVSQASAVDEITSTILDIEKKTQANTDNVKRALEMAEKANSQAKDGTDCMSEMLMAIHDIEESAREVEHIIGVIDNVAFQTNILALNAAIEAARAGEAGKGFAVVADEVRNLANKTSKAASQTGELITKSIEAVTRGTSLADTASNALNGIVDAVKEVSSVIGEISEANDIQASSVEQISQGMENVNSAIHNTTATAEESAAASEELSALAVSLSNTIARFKF